MLTVQIQSRSRRNKDLENKNIHKSHHQNSKMILFWYLHATNNKSNLNKRKSSLGRKGKGKELQLILPRVEVTSKSKIMRKSTIINN